MSKVVRSVKNVTKGYSSVQIKVRNATSNDPWGPTGTEMSEIAALTFGSPTDFYEIMDMLDKRLNDKGKNWRHVLKSLKVLDYCLHEGSELVVTWARKNIYIIKTLREFQYIDDEGRDVGQNVRVAARELTALILDEERLRNERSDRKLWKSRVTGIDEGGYHNYGGRPDPRRDRRRRQQEDEDAEYRLAIEASKAEAEEERKRRERQAKAEEEDEDLAKAIKLSKEEEELRRRELEESNAQSLFDDTPTTTQPAQPQPTGYNQGYQQQPAVDWFGNPIDPQQPMTTGFLNNQYSQPMGYQQTGYQTGFQTGYQPTGYQNGVTNGFQTQPTGFDPSQQFGQQQQAFLQPQTTLQPQATGFSNNPYGNNASLFGQQQQQQDNNYLQPGSHNPWAISSAQQQESLKPLPTGSNNPFAAAISRPQSQPSRPTQPSLNTLAEERATTSFTASSSNPILNYRPPTATTAATTSATTAATMASMQPKHEEDPYKAKLNALLASGEGQDTFGNVGELRVPAHHTAPGVFINSVGQGAQRLQASRTGNNPFYSQQQFVPQQTGFTQQNNPFGGRQQQQPQSGSLIDL